MMLSFILFGKQVYLGSGCVVSMVGMSGSIGGYYDDVCVLEVVWLVVVVCVK